MLRRHRTVPAGIVNVATGHTMTIASPSKFLPAPTSAMWRMGPPGCVTVDLDRMEKHAWPSMCLRTVTCHIRHPEPAGNANAVIWRLAVLAWHCRFRTALTSAIPATPGNATGRIASNATNAFCAERSNAYFARRLFLNRKTRHAMRRPA
jgi:hypothetical protein